VAKSEYLVRLQAAVEKMHGCRADHSASVPVHEVFQGKTVWKGVVEQFELSGHPKAHRCFAWSHRDGANASEERFVAVLELPPVDSPQTAVKVAVVAEIRRVRLN
jgi:hypothetical protein